MVLSNGAMPLRVLSDVVDDWIQTVKDGNKVCVTGGSTNVHKGELFITVLFGFISNLYMQL